MFPFSEKLLVRTLEEISLRAKQDWFRIIIVLPSNSNKNSSTGHENVIQFTKIESLYWNLITKLLQRVKSLFIQRYRKNHDFWKNSEMWKKFAIFKDGKTVKTRDHLIDVYTIENRPYSGISDIKNCMIYPHFSSISLPEKFKIFYFVLLFIVSKFFIELLQVTPLEFS